MGSHVCIAHGPSESISVPGPQDKGQAPQRGLPRWPGPALCSPLLPVTQPCWATQLPNSASRFPSDQTPLPSRPSSWSCWEPLSLLSLRAPPLTTTGQLGWSSSCSWLHYSFLWGLTSALRVCLPLGLHAHRRESLGVRFWHRVWHPAGAMLWVV